MKKLTYSLILSWIVAIGCSKENVSLTTKEVENGKYMITTAAHQGQESKSSVNDAAEFSWDASEVISVGSLSTHKYYDFVRVDETNTFSYTGGESPSNFIVAISPKQSNTDVYTSNSTSTSPVNYTSSSYQNKVVASSNVFAVTLKKEYDYAKGVTNAILIGSNQIHASNTLPGGGSNNDDNCFVFRPAAALIKVKYENLPSSARKIKLTADKTITGTFNGALEYAEAQSAPAGSRTTPGIHVTSNVMSNGVEGNAITINFTAEDIAAGIDYFYFPVPYGTYGSIQLELLDNGYQVIDGSVRTLSSGLTLAKGDVYTVPTITLFGNEETVGNTDRSSDFNSNAISTQYTIKPGQVLHMKFINYGTNSGASKAAWHNWNLEVWKNSDATHLFTVRADNYGWGNGETNDNLTGRMNTWIDGETWDDDTFMNTMEGAAVNLSVEYVNNLVMVYAECHNSDNGKTIKKTFFKAVDASTWGTLKANLRCDLSYMVVQNVWRTKSSSAAGLTSDETYYIYDADLDIQYVKAPESAKLFMTDGTTLYAHNNFTNTDVYSLTNLTSGIISAPASTVASGSSGTSVVTYDANNTLGATVDGVYTTLTIPWVKGLSAMGKSDYSAGWAWAPNTYLGDLSNGETMVIKQFLYSPASTWDDRWKNIIVQLAPQGFPSAWTPYKTVRLDPAYWDGDSYSVTETNTWVTLGSNDFSTQLNRSMVTITITKSSENITIRYDAELRNGNNYYQQYVIAGIGASAISWHHCADSSYAVIVSYDPPTNN